MGAPQQEPFGAQLRRHRIALGLTQQELAERASMSARGVRALEQGERTAPYKTTVALLADALGLSGVARGSFEAIARGRVPAPDAPIGGYLGALPIGRVIGRDAELHRILKAVENVVAGRSGLVLLEGEPGVGKTRLAQEALLALEERRFRIGVGCCYEPEGAIPYYPYLQALTRLCATLPHTIRDEIPRRWPLLAWLLRDQRHPELNAQIPQGIEQRTLFHSITDFLAEAARSGPIALLLDDLHWADTSSLELLLYLTRNVQPSSILLLGMYRRVELTVEHPLHRMVLDLSREGRVEVVALRRLDWEDTCALAADIVNCSEISPELLGRTYHWSDGNPFFVHQLLRAFLERGDLKWASNGWQDSPTDLEVPENVQILIGQRTSRLGHEGKAILQEASVLGQAFLFDDLQRMTSRCEHELDAALDTARSIGLLRVNGGGGYAFDHALIRQALYMDLSPHRQRRLHRAAADALMHLPERQQEKRASEIAWHLQQTAEPESSLPYLIMAGDAAATTFAYAEARVQYQAALALTRSVGDRKRELQVLERLGRVLRNDGRFDASLEVLEAAALGHRASGDIQQEAQVVGEIGDTLRLKGAPLEAVQRILPLLKQLEETEPSAVLVQLYRMLTSLSFVASDYRGQLRYAEHAAELAAALDMTDAMILSECQRGEALAMLGDLAAGIETVTHAARHAEDSGNLPVLVDCLNELGALNLFEGSFVAGRRCYERAVAIDAQTGGGLWPVWQRSQLANSLFFLGEWQQARPIYEEVLSVLSRLGESWISTHVLLHSGELNLCQGHHAEGIAQLDEAVQLAQTAGDLYTLSYAQRVLATQDLLDGRVAAAQARLEPLHDPSRAGECEMTCLSPVLGLIYAEGRRAGAEEMITEGVRRTKDRGIRPALVEWLLALSRLRRYQGSRQHALESLDECIRLVRAMEYPYAEARALYEYGKLEADGGDACEAQERLRGALAIFRRLAALPFVRRTEKALTELI